MSGELLKSPLVLRDKYIEKMKNFHSGKKKKNETNKQKTPKGVKIRSCP